MLVGYFFQDIEIVYEEFVIGKQYLEFRDFGWDDVSRFSCMHVVELVFLNDFSDLGCSLIVVKQTVERSPLFDFPAPLVESGQWG